MDNVAIIAATIVGAINAYIYFYDKREQKKERAAEQERMKRILQEEEQKKSERNEISKPETRSLVYTTLRQMNCQPEDTDEGRIMFEYQGVKFLMEAEDDCLFVNLIWPWCHSFNIYDVDEFARVRKVVNEINIRSTSTIFYIPNPESDEVAVHIRKNFIFIPQITQLSEYLQGILRSFFIAVRELNTEIERVRILECEK